MSKDTAHLVNRACAYGDGLFETIAIRDGQARLWELHLARLQTGCQRLGLECPDPEELLGMLNSKLDSSATDTEFASARLVISAAASARGYRRATGGRCDAELTLFPSARIEREKVTHGIATRICNTRLAIQPALAGLKSLNRLEQVLARAEWHDPHVFEGLMRDTDGRLICGTMSNVFLVKDSCVITPAITRCGVSGVMRAHLLRLLEEAEIRCEVRDINVDELDTAAEMFLSNSQFGILPIRRCDSRQFEPGTMTRRAQALLAANGVPECSV